MKLNIFDKSDGRCKLSLSNKCTEVLTPVSELSFILAPRIRGGCISMGTTVFYIRSRLGALSGKNLLDFSVFNKCDKNNKQ